MSRNAARLQAVGHAPHGRGRRQGGIAREAFAIPDVHYADHAHFVAGDSAFPNGPFAARQWTANALKCGCDFFTLKDGKIVKDSYWKIRDR